MKIKCTVVDDDPAYCELISIYVQSNPYLELTGKYYNAASAIEEINKGNTQLLFLDMNLPDTSGIQLIESLHKIPYLIFVTSSPDYSIDGWNYDAVDYLLKPINPTRFSNAIEKAYRRIESVHYPPTQATSIEQDKFMFIKSENKLVRINFEDIIYLESTSGLLQIHTINGVIFSWDSIRHMEDCLPTKQFARIHKKYLININKIDTINTDNVTLKGKTLAIGRLYKKDFYQNILHSNNVNFDRP